MLIKSPLGKRFSLWFEHTWILFTQRCFVTSLIEICPLGLEEKITKCLHFATFFPLKKVCPFIWTNLNPNYRRMFCDKFGWNWPRRPGEKEFKCHHCILTAISPWNKRSTGPNGHLSIRDFTLTSCQRGSYLYINSPIKELEILWAMLRKWYLPLSHVLHILRWEI